MKVRSTSGLQIALSYTRIVSSSKGSYIEMDPSQVLSRSLFIPEEARWRLEQPHIDLVYYTEFRTRCSSYSKVYRQKKVVKYADYKIGFWYVSVEEAVLDG